MKEGLPLLTDHDQYYKELDDAGFHFGPHFKLIRKVLHDRGRAMIEVIVPDGTVGPTGDAYPEGSIVDIEPGHHFHPILLDACLQVGKAAIDAPETNTASKNLYLPRRLGRVRLYRDDIPSAVLGVRRSNVFTEDMISFDIEVYDDNGERVADIFDFRTEPMEHIRDDDDVEANLYNYVWQSEAELSQVATDASVGVAESGDTTTASSDGAETQTSDSVAGKRYALFLDESGVCEEVAAKLESSGASVVRLTIGAEFSASDENRFQVTLDNEEDIRIALSSVDLLDGIVHGWSLDHNDSFELDASDIERAQQTGVLSALKIAHVLANLGTEARVYFVTRDSQSVVEGDQLTRPVSTAIHGMARVAFNENPDVRWRTIDLAAAPSPSDAQQIVDELAKNDAEPEVAYRDGNSYAQASSTDSSDRIPAPLEERGPVERFHHSVPVAD